MSKKSEIKWGSIEEKEEGEHSSILNVIAIKVLATHLQTAPLNIQLQHSSLRKK